MIKISSKERKEIISLSAKFVLVHKNILEAEKSIRKLEIESADLLQDLENCRKMEREYALKMQEKYGPGFLDPATMEWKKQELVYEN